MELFGPKSISKENFKTDCEQNTRPIFFRICQKKHNKWIYKILKELVKKNKKIIGFRERQTVTNYVTVLKYTDRVNIMNPKYFITPK